MGHNDDGAALISQSAQNGEQLVFFMRGKHGGRFVEDEQPGVAVEQLEDLNPLLHANGQVLHQCSGIDGQVVLLAQGTQPAGSLTQIELTLQAEHGVLDD